MTGQVSYVDHYNDGPYRDFAQEHRGGGTFGAYLIEVEQGEGDFTDPANDEFAFVLNLDDPDIDGAFDFGDGWFRHRNRRGCVSIQPPDTEVRFRIPAMRLLGLVVPRDPIEALADQHRLPDAMLAPLVGEFTHAPRVASAMHAMWLAAHRTDASASLDLDGAFLTMLGELIAACGHGLPPAPKLDDRRLARAVDYAETHIAAPLTVGELASAACMSPSAFSRAFRAATGETPWSYVRRRRLERAGEQMARTDDTLMQIAADCGFSDAPHLVRAWKAVRGRTPRGA